MPRNNSPLDLTERLAIAAGTVHGGAYAVMHEARKEIRRLRALVESLSPAPTAASDPRALGNGH